MVAAVKAAAEVALLTAAAVGAAALAAAAAAAASRSLIFLSAGRNLVREVDGLQLVLD